MIYYFQNLMFNPRNELEKLQLDLSKQIKNKGGSWKGKDSAQNVRKKFVTDLASAYGMLVVVL